MSVVARSRREYDRELASFEANQESNSESMVQQQFAKDADINEIVRRFGLTGEMPPPVDSPGFYGDFSLVTDFQSALYQLERARAGFEELPPEVREDFDNNPAGFVDWLADPVNWPAARDLGLLLPEVEVAAPAAPGAVSGAPAPSGEVSTG